MTTELFVKYKAKCFHSEREPERYGSWSEKWDFEVLGVGLTSRNIWQEEKFTIDFDVKAGDPVFVLFMTYNTGDTFGRATGKGEVLWVFKDAELAKKAKDLWVEENEKRDPEFSIEFEVDGGKKVKLSNPAAGYFENIGYIDLHTFLVNP